MGWLQNPASRCGIPLYEAEGEGFERSTGVTARNGFRHRRETALTQSFEGVWASARAIPSLSIAYRDDPLDHNWAWLVGPAAMSETTQKVARRRSAPQAEPTPA